MSNNAPAKCKVVVLRPRKDLLVPRQDLSLESSATKNTTEPQSSVLQVNASKPQNAMPPASMPRSGDKIPTTSISQNYSPKNGNKGADASNRLPGPSTRKNDLPVASHNLTPKIFKKQSSLKMHGFVQKPKEPQDSVDNTFLHPNINLNVQESNSSEVSQMDIGTSATKMTSYNNSAKKIKLDAKFKLNLDPSHVEYMQVTACGKNIPVTKIEGFTFPAKEDIGSLFKYHRSEIKKCDNSDLYEITEHFSVICCLCKEQSPGQNKKKRNSIHWLYLRNSNTNSESHIQRQHPDKYKALLATREEKQKALAMRNSVAYIFSNNRASIKNSKYSRNDEKQILFDLNVVNCVATDSRPFSLVTGDGFKKMILDLDSKIRIPSEASVRSKTTNICADNAIPKLNAWLENSESGTAILDNWASKRHESIMGVRFQKIDADFKLEIRTIGCVELKGSHTATQCFEKYKSIIKKFRLETKVSHVMTDRGSNMVAAFTNPMVLCPNDDFDEYMPLKEFERLLNEMSSESLEDEIEINIAEEEEIREIINEFTADVDPTNVEVEQEIGSLLDPSEEWLGCCAHMIHNCVTKALQINEEVTSFKKQMQQIVSFFQVRNLQLQSMRSQTGKQLVKSIAVRWNSFVASLERLTEIPTWEFVVKAIQAFLNDVKKSAKGRKAIEEGKYPKLPGHTEFLKAKELIKILLPLKVASNILQSDTPTASLVIPTVVTAYQDLLKLENLSHFEPVRETLLIEIKKTFQPVISKTSFILATVLDARIKTEIFPELTERVYDEDDSESHFVDCNLFKSQENQNHSNSDSEMEFSDDEDLETCSVFPDDLQFLRLPCQQHAVAVVRKYFQKAIYSEVLIPETNTSTTSKSQAENRDSFVSHGYTRMFSGWKTKSKSEINVVKKDEIAEYLNEPLQDSRVNISNKNYPLQYWKQNSEKWPYLAQYARKYLAIPASSGTCERLFSILINIGRARRSEIKVDTMEKLVFIKENVFQSSSFDIP